VFNGFNQAVGAHAASRTGEDVADRRRFLRWAGLAGLGMAGVGAVGATAGTAFAGVAAERADGPGDAALLTYLLNVQYLVAELVLRGAFGKGLEGELVGGAGRVGPIGAGRRVEFADPRRRQYVEEIATDARMHVAVLRNTLGPARPGRPRLDLDAGFDSIAATAALVERGQRFDVFAGEPSFVLGTFLVADLSVTAYRGVLPMFAARPILDVVGGILATVSQHAAVVRTMVLAGGQEVAAAALSDARASLDGRATLDQGVVVDGGHSNAVLADAGGLAPSRPPGRVLNILYGTSRSATAGGFFPWGVNGELNRSDGDP